MTDEKDIRIVNASHLQLDQGSVLESLPAENVDQKLKRMVMEIHDSLHDAETLPEVLAAADNRLASLFQAWVTEEDIKEVTFGHADPGGLEAKFDDKDYIGWAKSLISWIGKLKPHAWIVPPTEPDEMPENARVALLGDWGTGLYGAPVCSASIERADPKFNVIMHLGDVYYAGTKKEVQTRFIDLWPNVVGAINRAVNSNHEMYSGGRGYFELTLTKFKQMSSCFALQSAGWLLVGLDTGYEEKDLAHDQVAWLRGLIDAAGDRRVILFTHHQPYSHFESQGPKLLKKLKPWFDDKRIFAWYWGHEHRCVVYDKDESRGFYGRCIGHSGYPYFREHFEGEPEINVDDRGTTWHRLVADDKIPAALVLDGQNPHVKGHESKYGPNGYLALKLGNDKVYEQYCDASGNVVLTRELT